jgi:hypothetical protein
MNNVELTSYLKQENLILVNKDAFLDFMIEVNLKTAVDKRVKWLDRKTVIAKYGISKHHLIQMEKDCFSVLKTKKASGVTATKFYKEQSIIDELTRQEVNV